MKKRSFGSTVVAAFLLLGLCFSVFGMVARAQLTSDPKLALTFDDGYQSTYTLAFPYLDVLDIPATVSIAAMNVSDTFEGITTMTWDEIDDLDDHGWTVASHGTGTQAVDPPGSTFGGYGINSTEKIIVDEFNETTTDLFEAGLGWVPSTHVYAWGNHQNATVRMYLAGYYDNAWSGFGYGNMYDDWDIVDLSNDTITEGNRYRVPRFCVDPVYENKSNEATIIAQGQGFIDRLVANGSDFAGVLIFHHITDSPRWNGSTAAGVMRYNDMTPYVFVEIVDYARAAGVDFVTLGALESYFTGGASGAMSDLIDDWIPTILSFAMLGIVFGYLKKIDL